LNRTSNFASEIKVPPVPATESAKIANAPDLTMFC